MVPRMQAVFPRCIAALLCCIRNILTLVSWHTACILWPKSLTNSITLPSNAPKVSIANSWKMYVESSTDEYYCRFSISALVATTPGPVTALSHFRWWQWGLDNTVDITSLAPRPIYWLPAAQTVCSTWIDSHSTDAVMRRVQWRTQTQRYGNEHGCVVKAGTNWRHWNGLYRNAPEDGAATAIRRARLAGVWATDNTASVAISCRGWHHIFWLTAIDESNVGVLVIDCHIFI